MKELPTPYYQSDRCTLYCGDSTEILPPMELDGSVIVTTDPPFGIAHKSNGMWFLNSHRCHSDGSIDTIEWICDWTMARGFPLVCFFSPYQPPRVKWRTVLVWNKGAHVGIGGDRETCWKRDHELIGVRGNGPLNGKRDSSVLHYLAVSPPPSGHFCEKPEPLMQYLVGKVSNPSDTILDPFMGSGTTGVAAIRLGRKFIGIEIDEKYCAIAARRIKEAEEVGQMFREAAPQQMELPTPHGGE